MDRINIAAKFIEFLIKFIIPAVAVLLFGLGLLTGFLIWH